MFIRLFRSNSPTAIIILPLIAIAIWAAAFTEPAVVSGKHAMPLYELLSSAFAPASWLGMILALILVVCEGFLLNYIINEYEVLSKQSYLPAFFYILLMSNSSGMLCLHPLIPANLFMLFALNSILSSYRKDAAFSHAFDAGFLIAMATLFYFPYIVFFPMLGAGLVIFRPFNWREWIISFFGVLIPYIFAAVVYFWREELDYLLYDKMFFPIIQGPARIPLPPVFYVLIIIGILLLLISMSKLFSSVGSGPQKTKKGIILMVWFFIFSGFSLLVAPEISVKYFSALGVPVAVFYSFYFMHAKKDWLSELLCLLFVGTMVVNLVLHYI
jgi:hypothetical protein